MTTESKRRTSARKLPIWLPLVESSVLVTAMVAVNLSYFPDNPALLSWNPHPILLITLLMLVRYGFGGGVAAAIMCAVGHSLLLVMLVEEPALLYLLSPKYSAPVVVLVPITVVYGILVQGHLNRSRDAERRQHEVNQKMARLEQQQSNLRDVNAQLAARVVGTNATLSSLYEYAKLLNASRVADIYDGLLLLLQHAIEAETVAIWEVRSGVLRCVAHRGERRPRPDDTGQWRRWFDARGVMVLHQVPDAERTSELPFLAGELRDGQGGKVLAYLVVHALPFARYNAETIRLFALVIDWAATSIGKARILQASTRGQGRETFRHTVNAEGITQVAEGAEPERPGPYPGDSMGTPSEVHESPADLYVLARGLGDVVASATRRVLEQELAGRRLARLQAPTSSPRSLPELLAEADRALFDCMEEQI